MKVPVLNGLISSRRSVRKYKPVRPPAEDIDRILEAGRWAPSGLNNQPWRFLVIDDPEMKRKVSSFTKYGIIIRRAPVLIIVCMDNSVSYNREKDFMAIGASIENILLEAHSIGLGTCWLGEILNRKDELELFLELDEDLEIMAAITAGYPDESPSPPSRISLDKLKVRRK